MHFNRAVQLDTSQTELKGYTVIHSTGPLDWHPRGIAFQLCVNASAHKRRILGDLLPRFFVALLVMAELTVFPDVLLSVTVVVEAHDRYTLCIFTCAYIQACKHTYVHRSRRAPSDGYIDSQPAGGSGDFLSDRNGAHDSFAKSLNLRLQIREASSSSAVLYV